MYIGYNFEKKCFIIVHLRIYRNRLGTVLPTLSRGHHVENCTHSNRGRCTRLLYDPPSLSVLLYDSIVDTLWYCSVNACCIE